LLNPLGWIRALSASKQPDSMVITVTEVAEKSDSDDEYNDVEETTGFTYIALKGVYLKFQGTSFVNSRPPTQDRSISRAASVRDNKCELVSQ
jgi:hypothetical protein